MFPFTDGPETDPETGAHRRPARARRPQRHGAEVLPPADELGVLQSRRLAGPHRRRRARGTSSRPPTTRIYMIASAPHIVGAVSAGAVSRDPDFVGQRRHEPARLLARRPRAVPRARSLGRRRTSSRRRAVSANRRRHADAAGASRAGRRFPAYRCRSADDARIDWTSDPTGRSGIVTIEPPKIGKPFVGRVPAVDADGNDRARHPAAARSRCRSRRTQGGTIATPVDRRARSAGERDRLVPSAAAHARRARAHRRPRGSRSRSATPTGRRTSTGSRLPRASSSNNVTCLPTMCPS